MSKIGQLPISIPQDVTIDLTGRQITITGPKGSLLFVFRPEVDVINSQGFLKVTRKSDKKFVKALHGLTRSHIANMVKGVTEGHKKTLEIIGVGYKASMQGENILLNVGYSHPVTVEPLKGIDLQTQDNKIIVSGNDKIIVGEMAARIRRIRPPEPYKGKGIKYEGEYIRRKAGKAVKAAA
jgi:large subunit ribosomal protein L6